MGLAVLKVTSQALSFVQLHLTYLICLVTRGMYILHAYL